MERIIEDLCERSKIEVGKMKGLVKGEVTFKDSAAGLLLVETKKVTISRKRRQCLRDGSIIWEGWVEIFVEDLRSEWPK